MKILLIFLLPYCISATLEDDVISIPLKKMESPLQRLARENVDPKMIESIYRKAAMKSGSNEFPVPLFKHFDTEFYGEILIGHPGQKFKVLFDTAWVNTWVPSITCSLIQIGCMERNKYDSRRSSTYIPNGKPFVVKDGSYEIKGKLSTDLFHMGRVNVTNQTFAEIDTLPISMFFLEADGVLGLAFSKYSVDGVTPVFYNMYKQGAVKKQIFSFYMNRDPSTSKGGTIMFGGIQKKHYLGNFTELPINPNTGFWSFKIDNIFVTDKEVHTFCKNGCSAFADTSENTIRGPPDEIDGLNNFIGARSFYFGRYSVPCGSVAKLPKISFVLDGKNFTIKGEDYVQKIRWGPITVCLSSFKKMNATSFGDTWALGGGFLARYYVKFDMEKKIIGFADARL